MTDTPHHISDHAESANHWRVQAAEFRERANRAERVVEKARRVINLALHAAVKETIPPELSAEILIAVRALAERLAAYDAPDPEPVKGRCRACGTVVGVGELCAAHRGSGASNGAGHR